MFTGIIEEKGTVVAVRREGEYQRLEVHAERVLAETVTGDSIAIDGACQTVTTLGSNSFTVETLAVSLQKTTLGVYRPGRAVNLERAMTPTTRLGGHFVQGHVDGVAYLRALRSQGRNVFLTVEVPRSLAMYCVAEGSIALDGVSLTIADIRDTRVTINVIPVTWDATVLRDRSVGDGLNLEVDIIGRYVARMMGVSGDVKSVPGDQSVLTAEKLARWGYR